MISDIEAVGEYDSDSDTSSVCSDSSDALEINRPLKKQKHENIVDSTNNKNSNSNTSIISDNILQPVTGSLWVYLDKMYQNIQDKSVCVYIESTPYTETKL